MGHVTSGDGSVDNPFSFSIDVCFEDAVVKTIRMLFNRDMYGPNQRLFFYADLVGRIPYRLWFSVHVNGGSDNLTNDDFKVFKEILRSRQTCMLKVAKGDLIPLGPLQVYVFCWAQKKIND